MKKVVSIVSIALVVLMLAATLAACGGSSSPEGKYVVKSINGLSVSDAIKELAGQLGKTVEEFLELAGIGSGEEIYTLELKADGKAVMEVKMFSTTVEGTWKQNGDKIELTIDGETRAFTMNGNELSAEFEGEKVVFVKK